MEEDKSFDEFYAKLKDIVNLAFNFGKTIPKPKIVRKVFRSLPERFHVGMATGRVRAGFFHTRTRPAGQDPWPGPAPFRVPGFFPGPRPAPAGVRGARGPRLEIGPNLWPNQKKKKKSPDLFFPTFKPAYLNSSLDNVAQMPNHRLLIINK